jgi:hypothetical protein
VEFVVIRVVLSAGVSGKGDVGVPRQASPGLRDEVCLTHPWSTLRLASTPSHLKGPQPLQILVFQLVSPPSNIQPTSHHLPLGILHPPRALLYSIYTILIPFLSSNHYSGTLAEWLTRWPASCSSEQKLASSFGSVCSNHTGVATYLNISFCSSMSYDAYRLLLLCFAGEITAMMIPDMYCSLFASTSK